MFFSYSSYSQDSYKWEDIELIDTIKYAAFSHADSDNPSYPPSHLFDANYSTCWVANAPEESKNPVLYIRLPGNTKMVNIYSGYGKSEELFYKNARPKQIKLSLYSAINPDGYVSEVATLYKSVKYPGDKIYTLKDSAMVQHIPIDFNGKELKDFSEQVENTFREKFSMPVNHSCRLLKIEIQEVYPGTRWQDICISEIFFDNRFVAGYPRKITEYEAIKINKQENALIMRDNQQEIIAYKDPSSVLQLMDISSDSRWAVLISMPAEIQGRAETTYLLVNLATRSVVNEQLEKSMPNYQYGDPIDFEYGENGELYLLFVSNGKRIELR